MVGIIVCEIALILCYVWVKGCKVADYIEYQGLSNYHTPRVNFWWCLVAILIGLIPMVNWIFAVLVIFVTSLWTGLNGFNETDIITPFSKKSFSKLSKILNLHI